MVCLYCSTYAFRIEKTCPEFLTLFLQVMDDGRLTDGQGRLVDFRLVLADAPLSVTTAYSDLQKYSYYHDIKRWCRHFE